jgi:hypothetical protein
MPFMLLYSTRTVKATGHRDLGLMNDFLGMEAVLPLAISQDKYANNLLKKFNARLVVDHANALATLASMISRRY